MLEARRRPSEGCGFRCDHARPSFSNGRPSGKTMRPLTKGGAAPKRRTKPSNRSSSRSGNCSTESKRTRYIIAGLKPWTSTNLGHVHQVHTQLSFLTNIQPHEDTYRTHLVVLKDQRTFAANEIEAVAQGVAIRLAGTETLINADDIAVIYTTGAIDKIPIDPAILSTLATLETGIRKFEAAGGRKCSYTICGGASLALTLIPNPAEPEPRARGDFGR